MRRHEDRSPISSLKIVHQIVGCCDSYRDGDTASRAISNDTPLRRFQFGRRGVAFIRMKVPNEPNREAAWIL